jgi:hypothetical protein
MTGQALRITSWRTVVSGLLLAIPLRLASAQVDTTRRDTTRVIRPTFSPQDLPDSLKPPVSPGRAFLNSFFVPGLGQSRLGRPIPGAIFAGVEVMSIVMVLKTDNELRIAKAQASNAIVNQYRTDPATGAPILDENGQFVPADTLPNRFDAERVDAKRAQIEDWVAVLIFNHLIAGADAFVASLLWDFPARVGLRQLPRGMGVGLSVRWQPGWR